MIQFDDVATVCQEAFYLIRQDARQLTQENWDAGHPIEVAKCKLAVENVVPEVVDAFGWHADVRTDNVADWPAKVRNALTYALARKLSVQVAGRLEDLKTNDSLYRDALQNAKAEDLNDSVDTIDDPILRRVFAMTVCTFRPDDANLPRGFTQLMNRFADIKDMARREILMAHDWNFCKTVDTVGSAEDMHYGNYCYVTDYPRRAIRLIAVYSHDGCLNEWKIEGGLILSRRPITRIKYTRDVEDLNRWPEWARVAYARKVATLVARTVMNNPTDAQIQEQFFLRDLENAKLHDSRESSTPTDAWGDNYYADAMDGVTDHIRPNPIWR